MKKELTSSEYGKTFCRLSSRPIVISKHKSKILIDWLISTQRNQLKLKKKSRNWHSNAYTYNGYNSFHFFKKFVFAEFQINFHCCAGKRNEYTDEHFNVRCGSGVDFFFVLFFLFSDRRCNLSSACAIESNDIQLFCYPLPKRV